MYQLEPFAAVDFKVRAKAERHGRRLSLTYIFDEHATDGATPGKTNWIKGDELWRTTCFEAFLGEPDQPTYFELNFSPHLHQWNAYRFDDYRTPNPPVPAPDLELADVTVESGLLQAVVTLPKTITTLELSLCAVIRLDQQLHYFSTAHRDTRPNFHLRTSLTLRV